MIRGGMFCTLAGMIFIHSAVADQSSGTGRLMIASDDGNLSAEVGGRIHFDTYFFDGDREDPISTTEFRRARLAIQGKLWNWEYKLERDFASGGTAGLRDVYVATEVFGGKLTIGNFKPYRSISELTSSNDITLMERAFTSASGIFNNRQRQQGIGWQTHWGCYTFGAAAFNLRHPGEQRNEGMGSAGRFTWAPINSALSTLHFGGYASYENANRGSPPVEAKVNYAGRAGPKQLIALTPGDSNFFFATAGGDVEPVYLDSSRGSVRIGGLEFAATYGPLYLQAEYSHGKFSGGYRLTEKDFTNLFGSSPIACDPVEDCFIGGQEVEAWYFTGSWMVTGEHKPYDDRRGLFKSARPRSSRGAWEVAARYESIENRDIPGLKTSSLRLGVNFYFNPQVRFMLNAVLGDDQFTGDKTRQLALRAQASW